MTTDPPRSSLKTQRREYDAHHLLEEDTPTEPWALFEAWLANALQGESLDPTAMCLSTVSAGGIPSSRIVLLKEWAREGFVFFTNYDSRKGRELSQVPKAALLFHWQASSRQIHIEGNVERLTAAGSAEYFSQRPRESQLAARATSNQGVVPSRKQLDEQYERQDREWAGKPVKMPANWGGFRVVPDRFEFWQGRTNRLHDRLVYEALGAQIWKRFRLDP